MRKEGMRGLIVAVMLLAAPVGAGAQPAPRDETQSREVLEALPPVLEELQREDARRRAADDGRIDAIFAELNRQAEASEAAVDAAVSAERAGAPPEAALRPIAALEGRTPLLPRLAAAMQSVSPRTLAYARLAARHDPAVEAEGPRPSKALAVAAAAAWEAELSRLRGDPILAFEVGPLAETYARLGEPAAARRVVDLDPRAGPIARVEMLAHARAWDEAADLLARTTVGEVTAALTRERELEYEAERAGRSPAQARLAAVLPQFDARPDPARLREEATYELEAAREELAQSARRVAGEEVAARIEARLRGRRP